MNIYDSITADQIEDGDQIIVDGEAYEDVRIENSPDDEVRVRAYSETEGDMVTLSLPYDYPVDLWAV